MTSSQLPYIIVSPFVTCTQSIIAFGGGLPPLTIYPISTGAAAAVSLEQGIPSFTTSPSSFIWTVDFDAGANLTWVVVDRNGNTAYSQFRVVEPGNLTCPKNIYSTTSTKSTNVGAIIGGVVGALAGIALFILVALLYRRRRRQQLKDATSEEMTETYAESNRIRPGVERNEIGRGGEVVNAGTFNLEAVEFTEPSLELLRARDTPPAYLGTRGNRTTGA